MFGTRQPPGLGQWQRVAAQLHDLIFPPRCVACDRMGSLLCDACAQAVAPARGPLCARCGRLHPEPCATCALCDHADHVLARVRAAALHTGVMRDAIHHLKYADARGLAVPLARYLTAAWAAPDWDELRHRVDLVAPVPLHPARLQERGYNQSALLAQALCDRAGLTCMPDALARVRATQSQVGLDASARAMNVADAFAARLRLDGATVLLIDDVYTTGATLNACARAALVAGAIQVVALTLALPASRSRQAAAPSKKERKNVPELG